VAQEAQIIQLDSLFAAFCAEFTEGAMVVQNEPWSFVVAKAVKDLLSGLVMLREMKGSRPTFGAENDGGRLGLHSLMPRKDNPASGHEKGLIAAKRFPLPEQDGAVMKRADRGFAIRSPQSVESKGRLSILKGWAKNDLLPRMDVDVREGRGLGFVALTDQNGGGLPPIGSLEFGQDRFKIVGRACPAVGLEVGFVLAVQVSLDQAACDLHDGASVRE